MEYVDMSRHRQEYVSLKNRRRNKLNYRPQYMRKQNGSGLGYFFGDIMHSETFFMRQFLMNCYSVKMHLI